MIRALFVDGRGIAELMDQQVPFGLQACCDKG